MVSNIFVYSKYLQHHDHMLDVDVQTIISSEMENQEIRNSGKPGRKRLTKIAVSGLEVKMKVTIKEIDELKIVLKKK